MPVIITSNKSAIQAHTPVLAITANCSVQLAYDIGHKKNLRECHWPVELAIPDN